MMDLLTNPWRDLSMDWACPCLGTDKAKHGYGTETDYHAKLAETSFLVRPFMQATWWNRPLPR